MGENARAMVMASFLSDSLALGAHWIYDTNKIITQFGKIDGLLKPPPDSYHPNKEKGELTHYGDQTLVLLESIVAKSDFYLNDFFNRWLDLFDGYDGYFDQATRITLSNYQSGKSAEDTGSPSDDLGGAARIALARAATDKDPGVSHQAIVGAALLGHEASLGRLAALMELPDLPPALRRDALLALARAGDPAAAAALSGFLRRSGEIYERLEIIESLGELGDPRAAPALLRQMKTLRTKLAAIEALGKVRSPVAVPALARSLRSDRFVSWRRAAAQALGGIGDRRAVAALSAAVRADLEAEVVGDAVGALQRLDALPVALVPATLMA